MNTEKYATLGAHVPAEVARAAKIAAKKAGKRSVSSYLGDIVTERVLADAGLGDLARQRDERLKELADINAKLAAELGAATRADVNAENGEAGEEKHRTG